MQSSTLNSFSASFASFRGTFRRGSSRSPSPSSRSLDPLCEAQIISTAVPCSVRSVPMPTSIAIPSSSRAKKAQRAIPPLNTSSSASTTSTASTSPTSSISVATMFPRDRQPRRGENETPSYMSNAKSNISRRPSSLLELEEERRSFGTGLCVLEPRPLVYWESLEERMGEL